MGLLEQCQELFNTSDLYEVLGSSKQATEEQLRKSYYRVSLKVHPDRAPEDPRATEKFQVLGKVYSVLNDKEQRAIYDEQGVVDEEFDILSKEGGWEELWRIFFPKVTLQDILDFEKNYKGSDEEREDVICLYLQHEGDMDAIMASLQCSTQEDEPRVCRIIQEAIDAERVEAFPAFTKESKKKKTARRKRADRERQEAEEMQKEMGLGGQDESLVMMLQERQKSRQRNFDSFMSDLEAKYSKKSATSKRGKKK